jgi:hypothetical protein
VVGHEDGAVGQRTEPPGSTSFERDRQSSLATRRASSSAEHSRTTGTIVLRRRSAKATVLLNDAPSPAAQ